MAFQWVEILTLLLVPSHELERTTIRYERGRILFEDSASNSYSAETVHDSIYDFNAQWDDSWPLANCFFPEDPSLVIQAIVNDTAVMVSDGSYKPFLSTKISMAAWSLECSTMGASCFGEKGEKLIHTAAVKSKDAMRASWAFWLLRYFIKSTVEL